MSSYREGELIETTEELFFGVKGVLHPPDRVTAFLRYVPSEDGNRKWKENSYIKVYDLESKYKYLRENFPNYLFHSQRLDRKIQAVPIDRIKKLHKPENRLEELFKKEEKLSPIEKSALKLSKKIINKSGIEKDKIGVTGSILPGLHTPESDIDLVIYGEEEGRKAYSALKELRKSDEQLIPYDDENALRIAQFRWGKTNLPLEKLAKIEKKKVLHGMFEDRDFFIRLVKDREDISSDYEDFSYSNKGSMEIRGIVSDDENSIFTPNCYNIKNCRTLGSKNQDVKKIESYRGRFTEQARKGEKIQASGKVEEVFHNDRKYYRLLLESPKDYLIPSGMLS